MPMRRRRGAPTSTPSAADAAIGELPGGLKVLSTSSTPSAQLFSEIHGFVYTGMPEAIVPAPVPGEGGVSAGRGAWRYKGGIKP